MVVCADDRPGALRRIRQLYGSSVAIDVVPRQAVSDAINRQFAAILTEGSVGELARCKPEFSASRVITARQIISVLIIGMMCLWVFILGGRAAHYVMSGILAGCFAANAGLRALLTWKGAGEHSPLDARVHARPLLDDIAKWPIYTIIVPMYHEANVMADLVAAIMALDYPRDRLDVKLVLEADDVQTLAAAKEHANDPCFDIICVPPSRPRTKPKAANYALRFARGVYTVIYDAEDRPEPDQLKKALAMFRQSPCNVACLQARLNFYNADENWLTRGMLAQRGKRQRTSQNQPNQRGSQSRRTVLDDRDGKGGGHRSSMCGSSILDRRKSPAPPCRYRRDAGMRSHAERQNNRCIRSD